MKSSSGGYVDIMALNTFNNKKKKSLDRSFEKPIIIIIIVIIIIQGVHITKVYPYESRSMQIFKNFRLVKPKKNKRYCSRFTSKWHQKIRDYRARKRNL